jgi:hypothetical protein
MTVDDFDELITTYEDHDEWYRVVLPGLRDLTYGDPTHAYTRGDSGPSGWELQPKGYPGRLGPSPCRGGA